MAALSEERMKQIILSCLPSTMLQMAKNYDLQYLNLSTAASPGYPTQLLALNSPLAFLVLACLGV